jgi:hypothetical protein
MSNDKYTKMMRKNIIINDECERYISKEKELSDRSNLFRSPHK